MPHNLDHLLSLFFESRMALKGEGPAQLKDRDGALSEPRRVVIARKSTTICERSGTLSPQCRCALTSRPEAVQYSFQRLRLGRRRPDAESDYRPREFP